MWLLRLTACLLLLTLASGLRPSRDRLRGGLASRRRRTTTPATTTTTTPAPADAGGADYETECPEKYGFFADAFQCDRYYECHNWQITEKLCPDGLVFNDFSVELGKCDLMHSVNCTGREELQAARPSGKCPRQNGFYPDEDPAVCDKFVQCTMGKVNPLTCPAGLIFSLKTSTCQWPDQAGRTCKTKEYVGFDCTGPRLDPLNLAPGQSLHPRFRDAKDCQFFFTCDNGVTPRRHGCEKGRVFNDAAKRCDDPKNVPECKDWYNK